MLTNIDGVLEAIRLELRRLIARRPLTRRGEGGPSALTAEGMKG